jgi:aryl-alcohol dehydrogenase-like predicted oxidoreductase
LRRWHEWLGENKISALQASLSFPLSFPQVDRVVVGVDSQSQLQQIVSAENYPMKTNVPNFACEDENLINPANWSKL